MAIQSPPFNIDTLASYLRDLGIDGVKFKKSEAFGRRNIWDLTRKQDGYVADCRIEETVFTENQGPWPTAEAKPTGRRAVDVARDCNWYSRAGRPRFNCKKGVWDYAAIADCVIRAFLAAVSAQQAKDGYQDLIDHLEANGFGGISRAIVSRSSETSAEANVHLNYLNKDKVLAILRAARAAGVEV